ncbi:MAG: hypothetical protein ILO43_02230 [Clostridia bacterium]|nr:hypothetical protein [Clostridia bacterium]
MAVRVGVTDGNREFFERFRSVLMDDYKGEFEVYLFPDLPKALKAADLFRIRVILLEPDSITPEEYETLPVPEDVAVFRLADRMQTEKQWEQDQARRAALAENGVVLDPEPAYNALPVYCRYRSAAEWRARILKAVAETGGAVDKEPERPVRGGADHSRKNSCRVALFTSAAGGTGVSTAARAFTECCLRHSRHVLFLDLQTFPGRQASRTGDDLYTMEDVVLSLRGRKYAPDAVLDRAIRTEEDGRGDIVPPVSPAVLFDMTGEEIVTLLDLVEESERFSIIVLDLPFDTSERIILPFRRADKAVLVTNGTQIANRKTAQLLDALPSLCAEEPVLLYEKTCLLYNRFVNGAGEVLQTEVPLKLGGIKELDLKDPEDLTAEVSATRAIERLYERLTE